MSKTLELLMLPHDYFHNLLNFLVLPCLPSILNSTTVHSITITPYPANSYLLHLTLQTFLSILASTKLTFRYHVFWRPSRQDMLGLHSSPRSLKDITSPPSYTISGFWRCISPFSQYNPSTSLQSSCRSVSQSIFPPFLLGIWCPLMTYSILWSLNFSSFPSAANFTSS